MTGLTRKQKKKKVLKTSIALTKIPYTDYKSVVNKIIFKKWQDHWDTYTNNKLHNIKPTIGEWNIKYKNRGEQVVLTHIHISHTYITHNHLLERSGSPICSTCKKRLTVKYILLECVKFNLAEKILPNKQFEKTLYENNTIQDS